MKLEYTKDVCGNDILQDETGRHQVMMEWEKPYMEACIDKLDISGSVLEIGFGLGYSAHRICSAPNITKYTVIECCPIVWEKVENFKKKFPSVNINLIKGRWQDVLYTCGKYDRCFFDDYVLDGDRNRFLTFLKHFLTNHANIGCNIGSYYQFRPQFNNIPFLKTECDTFEVDIPSHCTYAKGTQMYIIKITKLRNLLPGEIDILKDRKSNTTLQYVDAQLSTTSRSTFTMVSGAPAALSNPNTYAEIETLYSAKNDTQKLARMCEEYLQENSINNRQRRMVTFFQGYAYFYSNPSKSKEIFSNLLNVENIEDDIRNWAISNRDLLKC